MLLLFSSRYPVTQLLLPHQPHIHMHLPMFHLSRITLTPLRSPSRHNISRPHRSRIRQEMHTPSLLRNRTVAISYRLARHSAPRGLPHHQLHPHRPNVARTAAGTMRQRSLSDARPAGLRANLRLSRRLSQTLGQLKDLYLIRCLRVGVSPQLRLLRPPGPVVCRHVPLRHPRRVASRSRLRTWPLPLGHTRRARARSLIWRIQQTQFLWGSSHLRGSMHPHSVAM